MNPADLTISISPGALSSRPVPAPLTTAQKNGKTPVPRVDLEPIYTQLKGALGDQWADYKAAINAFVLGNLNQAELSWVLHPLLSPAPSVITSTSPAVSPVSTLNLHNTLLAAIYANTLRDPPPTEVAPWVVATDKPTSTAKNASSAGTNDKTEERLRKEVMGIHARDRRRIKGLKPDTTKPSSTGFTELQSYRAELAPKPPDITQSQTSGGGGITRTNWEPEIRKRYAQPLAEETLEFPTIHEIQSRIEPICYEEGLSGGSSSVQTCAELMEQATEVFLKELLGNLVAHSQSNVVGADCIRTRAFRRRVRREEADVERGTVARNAVGLLPVEMEEVGKREALGMGDLRLALEVGDRWVGSDRFLAERVMLSRYAEPAGRKGEVNGVLGKAAAVNGVRPPVHDDMVLDADHVLAAAAGADRSWKGSTKHDTDDLLSALDDCLAVG